MNFPRARSPFLSLLATLSLSALLAGCPQSPVDPSGSGRGGTEPSAAATASAAPTVVAAMASEPLAKLSRDYLDGLFAAKPHLAQFMGDHRFDGRHADLSAEAVAARIAQLQGQRARLDAIAPNGLSDDERVDVEILRDGIALERLYLEEIREFTWDPRLYDSFPYYDPREIVAERFAWLIHGTYAPPSQRLASLTELLAGLPRLLEQYQANLGRPAKIYTEKAIEANAERIKLCEGEVAEFTRSAPAAGVTAEATRSAEQAREQALVALRSYQRFLETTLLPRSDGDWRLGEARYNKKFPLALQTRLRPEQVVPRAEAAFRQARAELYTLALELHAKLLPKQPRPKPGQPGAAVDPATEKRIIEAVRDELARDHVTAADYVANEWRSLDGLRAFIEQHDLLALPPVSTLLTQPMPAYKRGVIAAEYLAPGMLDQSTEWRATYSVDPVDPSWPADKVESYLRANNRYSTELRAVHEAYPGHHVQTWYARQRLNPLRAVLWNAAMVEGWAVYGEDLMVRLGLGGEQNDRYRFFTLRGHMVVATNAMLDIQLQTGRMSEKEAVRFMVEEGFQEQAMAEKKLTRAKLDSTQLCQYFLGYDEILELERDYRAKVGDSAFRQRTFDEALVGKGSIAVKHLRRYLLGD